MVLYVVTVSYVAFCCLILGWLVATEDTVIEALVVLGGTYGTLLTGVPVLIAVLVAKQQLDANRTQHVAAIRRSFIKEINVLCAIRSYAVGVINYKERWFYKASSESDYPIFTTPSFDPMIVDSWPDVLPSCLRDDIIRLEFLCMKVVEDHPHRQDFEAAIATPIYLADKLIKSADEHQKQLSQYWS